MGNFGITYQPLITIYKLENQQTSHFNSVWMILDAGFEMTELISSGNLIENGYIVLYYLICNVPKIAQKTENITKFISKRVSGGFIF